MRIQDEFVFSGVIENGHLFRTDDDEPLLFDRVQPAHEDVGLNPAREIELAQGDVKDLTIEIGAALAEDTIRHLVQE